MMVRGRGERARFLQDLAAPLDPGLLFM